MRSDAIFVHTWPPWSILSRVLPPFSMAGPGAWASLQVSGRFFFWRVSAGCSLLAIEMEVSGGKRGWEGGGGEEDGRRWMGELPCLQYVFAVGRGTKYVFAVGRGTHDTCSEVIELS